jgi:hypothetical protein
MQSNHEDFNNVGNIPSGVAYRRKGGKLMQSTPVSESDKYEIETNASMISAECNTTLEEKNCETTIKDQKKEHNVAIINNKRDIYYIAASTTISIGAGLIGGSISYPILFMGYLMARHKLFDNKK